MMKEFCIIGESTSCRNTEHQIIRNAQLTNQRNSLKCVIRVMFRPQTVRNTGIRMEEKPKEPVMNVKNERGDTKQIKIIIEKKKKRGCAC